MPQTYEDLLDLDVTPVDYLDKTGDKEERTRIRTYLVYLNTHQMKWEHLIRELSGGQKAKSASEDELSGAKCSYSG